MTEAAPGGSGRRPGFIFALGALAAISATAIDITIPAQPQIARAFGADPAAGASLVSSYFWGYALGQLLWGTLSDRFGRLRPLTIALTGFLITCVVCAFAPSFTVLVLARLAQGFFGGAAPITVRAIARDQGGGGQTASLLATTSMIIGMAPLLAPPLASGLLLVFDWRSAFWFLFLFTVVVLVAVRLYMKEPASHGITPGGVGSLRMALPLLRNFEFLCGAVTFAVLGLGYFALLSVGSAAAEQRYGVTPQAFGPLFSLVAVGFLCGSYAARRTVARFDRDKLLLGACLISAVSGALMAATLELELPQWLFWLLLAAYDFGFGFGGPIAMAKALEPAGKTAGAAASLMGIVSLTIAASSAQLNATGLFATAYHAIGFQMAAAGLFCLALQLVVLWRRRAEASSLADP